LTQCPLFLDAALRETDGVPPEVLREFGLVGLTLQPTPTQNGYQLVVATARV
jgi:hypothetical protein